MKNKTTNLFPKFALKIHELISEQFPKTYFVGGAVRNILLGFKIVDVDIATSALPEQVCALLKSNKISFSDENKRFGIIVAKQGKQLVEIATFRKELYSSKSRFPKVTFSKNPSIDSKRRDFTVNALYYSPHTKELLDFHKGLSDLNDKRLKFIGDTYKKISQDPLRIIRALKFSEQYNLQIDSSTKKILNTNLHLLKKVNDKRLQKEISNVKTKKLKNYLQKVIHSNS